MKFGYLHLYVFEQMRKKPKYHPNRQKRKKTSKIVRMTSYSHCELSKKSAAQKYWVLIFRTNEGDFGGIPVKNQ